MRRTFAYGFVVFVGRWYNENVVGMLGCDELGSGTVPGERRQHLCWGDDVDPGNLENLLIELIDALFTFEVVVSTTEMLSSAHVETRKGLAT